MRWSADYHDYVFKNGKFIGKFEEMYKYSKVIPWHQHKTAFYVSSDIDIAILKQFKYDSICEIGCGFGYFTNRLFRELSANNGGRPKVTGIDISGSAVEKAKTLFPGIRFVKGNLLKEKALVKEVFDLIVLKESIWYVCHKLPQFFKNTSDVVKENGVFYVSQAFPETTNWVGKKIIDSPERLIKILCKYTEPIHYCIEWDWNFSGRPLVHFLGRIHKYEDKQRSGNSFKVKKAEI